MCRPQSRRLAPVCGLLLAVTGALRARTPAPALQWSFERIAEGHVDTTAGRLTGHARLARGVRGSALVLDGYTTCVTRPATEVPSLTSGFTIEGWVALGAYPWNWAPLAAQENTVSRARNTDRLCWPDDLDPNCTPGGFFFGVGPRGHLGLHLSTGVWQVCRSDRAVALRRWTHVAATYDPNRGITLYLDGRPAGHLNLSAPLVPAPAAALRIGMAHQAIEPSHPVRPFATLACRYSLDGLLDELRLYDHPLEAAAIAQRAGARRPPQGPDLAARVLPAGPAGPGRFGAAYTHLAYYPEWDAQWRVGADPDVVVRFDDSPVRVVFWRGTRYSPAWVMENGLWMADQSIENFNDRDGCIEHMLDARCRFSHVRILENSPARVVVHWRYCPTAANGHHSQVDSLGVTEDWVDETYSFYPDQVGVRKVVLHSSGQALWPEEVIGLCQPGQRPEDVVDLAALTLVNLQGHAHTYSWADASPKIRSRGRRERGGYIDFNDAPGESPNILMVNFKSRYRPFQIFELNCNVSVFAHEQRKDVSHFPWWNHWPVALIPSDGRYCQAADRASHFSLAWASPQPHRSSARSYTWTWLYGATREEPTRLTDLARSWVHPPSAVVRAGATTVRFDATQRAYVVTGATGDPAATVTLALEADAARPLHHPAFVVEGWGDRSAAVTVNGRPQDPGPDLRIGRVPRLTRDNLVLWLRLEAQEPTVLSLTANPDTP